MFKIPLTILSTMKKNGIDDGDVSATDGLATKNLTIGSSSSYSRGRFLTFKNILVKTT